MYCILALRLTLTLKAGSIDRKLRSAVVNLHSETGSTQRQTQNKQWGT